MRLLPSRTVVLFPSRQVTAAESTRRRLITVLFAALVVVAGLGAGPARTHASHQGPEDLGRLPTQPCFGAASRDPKLTCGGHLPPDAVFPSPELARTLPNTPCAVVTGSPDVCAFGVPADRARQTVALVGDSHAGHWRGAVEAVARAHGWRGLSITHTSCPLSKAVRRLPTVARVQACVAWKQQVFAWFTHHPEIHTVFVAGLSGGAGVYSAPGHSPFATSVAGYLAAWRALPATVQHIVVIRDTPKMWPDTGRCVDAAIHAGHAPGTACAVPRGARLDPDPLVVAAHRLNSPRVQVVDLTDKFCNPRECFPVVGDALVLRDVTHMTATFSRTLGPYLLQAVDQVMSTWS